MSEAKSLKVFDFFPANRDHALRRLHAFVPQMADVYQAQRNTDFGPGDRHNISCLSPFHAHRLLFEEETIKAALDAHGPKAAQAFVGQVYWRTYFKGWLEQRPSVWTRYKSQVEHAYEALQGGALTAYTKAIEGRTGIACFDAWSRDLVETGHLHNHARLWFASIWIFTLNLPWALGADFFYRHLLDGDAASNTLSWRWVAGLHTPGKNYVASASNIAQFTGGRFDPKDDLAQDPAPLSDDWNGEPGPLPGPSPYDPAAKSILLLHEDDLGYETLPLSGANIVAIAGVTVTDDRSPKGVSETAKRFTIEAMEDALSRANEDIFVPTRKLASPEGLVELAGEHEATQLIFGYAPVGPVQDRLNAARPVWERAGLKIAPVLRTFDQEAWPHCRKGYFKLKEKIPALIERLQQSD